MFGALFVEQLTVGFVILCGLGARVALPKVPRGKARGALYGEVRGVEQN